MSFSKTMQTGLPPAIRDAYAQIKTTLPAEVIGLMLIGSRAQGQAIGTSDYDTRLVIRSGEPFVCYQDPVWTKAPDVATMAVGWADLNKAGVEGVSFGLTNLSFVERCVEGGYFPLNDHTTLLQGQVAIDETGAVTVCRARYRGAAFANIVPDYTAQTNWRVTQRLSRELAAMRLGEELDARKEGVPALHTCCRIVQEIAQIESYRQRAIYLDSRAEIAAYYAAHWPDFGPTFASLFQYKTDEARRREVFAGVQAHEAECLREAEALAQQTLELWRRFLGRGDAGDDIAEGDR